MDTLNEEFRMRSGRHFGDMIGEDMESMPPIIKDKELDMNHPVTEMSLNDINNLMDGSSGERHAPIDFNTILKLLKKINSSREEGDFVGLSSLDGVQDMSDILGKNDGLSQGMATWELVLLQAVLLGILVLISIMWAFCCKHRCSADRTLLTEMVAIARKISGNSQKDLPPAYSKVDLTQIGLTIDDHLYPPPTYDKAKALEVLERKHGRRFSRFSVDSAHSMANSERVAVDVEAQTISSSGHKSSSGSRVTFLPSLETGPTAPHIRTTSLPLVSAIKHEVRKRSAESEGGAPGSRRNSILSEASGRKPSNVVISGAALEEAQSIDIIDSQTVYSSSNNLNSQPSASPMI